jgi:hypothetical protein
MFPHKREAIIAKKYICLAIPYPVNKGKSITYIYVAFRYNIVRTVRM